MFIVIPKVFFVYIKFCDSVNWTKFDSVDQIGVPTFDKRQLTEILNKNILNYTIRLKKSSKS